MVFISISCLVGFHFDRPRPPVPPASVGLSHRDFSRCPAPGRHPTSGISAASSTRPAPPPDCPASGARTAAGGQVEARRGPQPEHEPGAMREWPPRSKKLSSTPKSGRSSTSRKHAQNQVSVAVRAATGAAARGDSPSSPGAGSALRSSLPLGFWAARATSRSGRGPCIQARRNAGGRATDRQVRHQLFGNEVSHELLVSGLDLVRNDRGFADGGVLCDAGFDLARFNAKTAQFDLAVQAAQCSRVPSLRQRARSPVR